jgi:hypothetical protein
MARKYSPDFGNPTLSAIISIMVNIFMAGFALAYFLFPRIVDKISLVKPTDECKISKQINDFLEKASILFSLDQTTDSACGSGFLIEDTIDSRHLFLITAKHNFFDTFDSLGHKRSQIRDPIYFWTCCQQGGKDIVNFNRINVTFARDSSKTLMFHSDPGIDLAIYNFEIDSILTYQFLKDYMLSPSEPCTTGTPIFYNSFVTGYVNPVTKLLKTRCKLGNIDTIAYTTNIIMVPKIFLNKDCAIVEMENFILPAESGSPVFLNFCNRQQIDEIRLLGVLFGRIGESESSTRLGTMVMVTKIKELIDEYNIKRSKVSPRSKV